VSTVGPLLRHWRSVRRVSQLDLSLRAHVSQRHLSYVETGKAEPSRQLLVHLGEVLELPLRDRNALLQAGGYVPRHPQTGWDDPGMAPVRRAIQFLLDRHEPYPAVVLDRRWQLVTANAAAAALIGAVARPAAIEAAGGNLMRLLVHPDGLRHAVVNWEEVAGELAERIRGEAAGYPRDAELQALAAELVEAMGPLPTRPPDAPLELLLPVHLRIAGADVRMFSMLASVGSALDVTVSELVIELFHPADEASAGMLRRLQDGEVGGDGLEPPASSV
jgi:transcriptional regulator with XRE-family HTH domain